jgi:hypothetical protein
MYMKNVFFCFNGILDDERAESAYNELKKWADLEDSKYVQLEINYLKAKGHFGGALKLVLKNIESNAGNAIEVIKRGFFD